MIRGGQYKGKKTSENKKINSIYIQNVCKLDLYLLT